MSAAAWEGPLAPNHDNNGAFNGTIDPSAMDFNGSPDFDFGQTSNTPVLQHMANGMQRNGSPAMFQQPTYQTNSVVPSKRPHADTISNSPRQGSRSITPQQPQFPQAFPNAKAHPTSNGYQNFNQVNSTTASPSPVMPNQQFNMNGGPHQQRLNTASPSPYSPAGTNAGAQMSPAPSDYSNHGDVGQNGVAGFQQNNPYINGHGMGSPAFNGSGNQMMPQPGQMNPRAVPGSSNMSQEETARRMQVARNAAMARQQAGMLNAGSMSTNMAGGPNRGAGSPTGPRPNTQAQGMVALPPSLQQQQMHQMQQLTQQLCHPAGKPENFLPVVAQFNQSKNLPFSPTCYVAGRQIHPMNLWILVMQAGGAQQVTNKKLWVQIAARLLQNMQDPQQAQLAMQNMMDYWKNNFALFERQKLMEYQQKRAAVIHNIQLQAAQHQGQQGAQPRPMQTNMPNMLGPQNPAMMHMRKTSGMEQVNPQMSPQRFPNQTQNFPQGHPQRPGTGGSLTMTTPMPPQTQMRNMSPSPAKRTGSASLSTAAAKGVQSRRQEPAKPQQWEKPADNEFKAVPWYFSLLKDAQAADSRSDESFLEPHGPLRAEENTFINSIAKFEMWKPDHPSMKQHKSEQEFQKRLQQHLQQPNFPQPLPDGPTTGIIDIHALNMAVKSGIGNEVGVALSTIADMIFNYEQQVPDSLFPITLCDDLLESLMDCAQENLDTLVISAEKKQTPGHTPYEELVADVEADCLIIQDVSPAGTMEHELDVAAGRLLCIIQILHNLAIADDLKKWSNSGGYHHPHNQASAQPGYGRTWEENLTMLTSPYVITFVTNVIEAVGSHEQLLRSNRNTLDLYKDLIMFLCDTAAKIKLDGEEEAKHILRFLHAFGPGPLIAGGEGALDITFFAQEPAQHRYLRYAVDTLARLLAAGDPSRAIITSALTSQPQEHLLTRTFALAIAPIPAIELQGESAEHHREIIRWRQSYIKQGILAADVLVTMLPSGSSNLARSWLHSSDGWTSRIIRLVRFFSFGGYAAPQQNPLFAKELVGPLIERSLDLLAELVDRSQDNEGGKGGARSLPSLLGFDVLREAFAAFGDPGKEDPNRRARSRRVLKLLESLVDKEA